MFQSIDIDSQLDAINVDFSDVQVLNDDTEKKLVDFRDSVNIDFAGFSSEVWFLFIHFIFMTSIHVSKIHSCTTFNW